MGQCGCSGENNFFKVGDKLLVMENWDEIYPEIEKLKVPEKLLTKFDKLLKKLLEDKLGEA